MQQPTVEEIAEWLRTARSLPSHNYEGYQITDAIDGSAVDDREVSLVRADARAFLPPHIHEASDAWFHIVDGTAKLITTDRDGVLVGREVASGDFIEMPRQTPHGFAVHGEPLTFVAIQMPPIQDRYTKEYDFVPFCGGSMNRLIRLAFCDL